MDRALEIFALSFVVWRIVLGGLLGLLLAALLSFMFPNLPAGARFALVFLGASGGTIWHAAVHSVAHEAKAARSLSVSQKVLAFLAVSTMGGGWGSLVERLVGVSGAVIVVLVTPLLLGPLFATISKERVTLSAVLLAAFGSLLGYLAPYALPYLFAFLGA